MMINLVNQEIKVKEITILSNVNMKINDGDVILLTGHNGSGKSIFLRFLSKVQQTDFEDTFQTRGVVIEKSKLIPHMTGMEFLDFLNKLDKKTYAQNMANAQALIKLFGVESFADKKIRTYSLGTKHKFALIQALMIDPELLLLDEPTDSLDKKSIEIFYNYINTLIDSNKTIIIVAHNDNEVKQSVKFTHHYEIEGETIVEKSLN